jgi:hypothetical protein
MKYEYFVAYKLEGLWPPQDGINTLLVDIPSEQLKAHILTDINDQLQEFDKSKAVPILIFEGRGDSGMTLEEMLPLKLIEVRKRRTELFGSGLFLFLQACGDIKDFNPQQKHNYTNFSVIFDEVPSKEIKLKYLKQINGLLSAFALASEYVCQTRKVSEGVVYYDENLTPMYSFHPECHGTFFSAPPLTNEHLDYVKS